MGATLAEVRVNATTLADLLLLAADQNPHARAVVMPQTHVTYTQLCDRVLDRARSLRALGIGPGDHVGILMPTCLDFVEVMFAVSMLGAVVVPVNARYRPPEIVYLCENADLVMLITTDRFAEAVNYVERVQQAFPGLGKQSNPHRLNMKEAPLLRSIIVMGDSDVPGTLSEATLDGLVDQVSEDEVHLRRLQTRVGNTALILYTSGTTSHPKGCMIAHESITRNCRELARRYELGPGDSFWSPLPMFHIASIQTMLCSFTVAGSFVTTNHFEAGEALRMLQAEKVTTAYPSFWTIMSDLVSHPDFTSTDLSSIRVMNANFAVQPPAIGEKMEQAMPHTIYVGTFGMTEAAGTVSTSELTHTRDQRFKLLGTPLLGQEIRIVNPETGMDTAPGEKGEAWIRGCNTFTEYYKSPEKTAQALDTHGWFHSGDICSVNGDGQVMFYGRLKDMLKVGGENVAAAEVESCLQTHPAVKLAQVVGIPDPRLQEVVAAFVELNPGKSADAAELTAFCRERIAGFKVPRHLRFVTEWPLSSTKIQKFRLQEQLLEELGLKQ